MAVANLVERFDPIGALDVIYPLHAAAAGLEDLKRRPYTTRGEPSALEAV